VKRLLPFLALLLCAACTAEPPATPTHAAIVFITLTPSPVLNVTPTEEILPFRDLSSPTVTFTPVPPSNTPEPVPATQPVVAAPTQAPRPTARPQPTDAPVVADVQVTAQVVAVAPPTDVPVVAPTALPVQPAGDVASAEQAIIDLTNNYRAQSGLAPLARDEGMMSIARGRSTDMVNRGYFGHYDPITGQSMGRPLIQALGYNRAGENIYWSGQGLGGLANTAVGWFMGDAPHRANILNTGFTVLGVGVVWNGVGWTLTQDFGGP
jgi:uncharacterized protein YkwD